MQLSDWAIYTKKNQYAIIWPSSFTCQITGHTSAFTLFCLMMVLLLSHEHAKHVVALILVACFPFSFFLLSYPVKSQLWLLSGGVNLFHITIGHILCLIL